MNQPSPQDPPVVYQTLDGMRGLAAICVVLLHATMFPPIATGAYLAPDLFFVLSGFVIAHAYDRKLEAGLGVWRFIQFRMIRFYPFYLIGLALGIAAAVWSTPTTPWVAAAIVALFFLPFPMRTEEGGVMLFPLNPPAWTLFYELLVNGVYAALYKHLSTKKLVIGVAITAIAMIGIGLMRGTLSGGWNANAGQVAIAVLRVTFSFGVGILIFRAQHLLPKVCLPPIVILLLVLPPLLIAPVGPWILVRDLLSVMIYFPVLVWAGIHAQPRREIAPLFKFLGLTSYGVYAIHQPILKLVEHWTEGFAYRSSQCLEFLVVASILLLAYLIDRFVDFPIRRKLVSKVRKTGASA